MPTLLSVNLNAVAQLRNRRDLPWPSVTGIAQQVLSAGAHGLTVHPRPDERHIRRHDVYDLAEVLREPQWERCEYNIEGYPTDDFLTLVEEVRPDQVTLVPDDPAQATSDHGWDFAAKAQDLKAWVARLKAADMRVALFVDPTPDCVEAAAATGTDRIEIFTGPYGAAFDDPAQAAALRQDVVQTVEAATKAGLSVNAGHDLTLDNLTPLIEAAPQIAEVSIGHSLTADALRLGYTDAVKKYLAACGWA